MTIFKNLMKLSKLPNTEENRYKKSQAYVDFFAQFDLRWDSSWFDMVSEYTNGGDISGDPPLVFAVKRSKTSYIPNTEIDLDLVIKNESTISVEIRQVYHELIKDPYFNDVDITTNRMFDDDIRDLSSKFPSSVTIEVETVESEFNTVVNGLKDVECDPVVEPPKPRTGRSAALFAAKVETGDAPQSDILITAGIFNRGVKRAEKPTRKGNFVVSVIGTYENKQLQEMEPVRIVLITGDVKYGIERYNKEFA